MFTSAVFWVSGFLVGSLGVYTEQLWLLYLRLRRPRRHRPGHRLHLARLHLIKWFPDRPGLATGMAIMGFSGGALIASPLSRQLMNWYDPGYDPAVAGTVPSGNAVAMLFLTLAGLYLLFMMFGAFIIRMPAEGWRRTASTRPRSGNKSLVTTENVSANNAIKTPQFWLLWTVLFCNVTAGIGILEQAAPMIQDFFRQADSSSWPPPPPPASSGCSRCSTWAAGSSGPPRRTTSGASRST